VNGPVHTIIGLSTGIAASLFWKDKLPFLTATEIAPVMFTCAITIGSTAPDLDLPGRPLAFFGHRGFTHTLVVPTALLVLASFLPSWLPMAPFLVGSLVAGIYGLVWGWVFHILADTMQHAGVPLFWPIFPKRVHIASMPVKFDWIFLTLYIGVLSVLTFLTCRSGDMADALNNASAGVIVAVVLGIITIKKLTSKELKSKFHKKRRRK